MTLWTIKPLIVLILNGIMSLNGINAMIPSATDKSWTYEIKSVESVTADSNLLNVDFKVDRVSRGVYSMSGTFKLGFDMAEGDNNEIQADAFRSDSGVGDYKVLPFKMQRQHYFKALNSFYKDMLMATLKDCSDLPVFEDKFEPPLEKKTYTLDKCQFSQDGFPNHLQDGFYKILVSGFGSVEWTLTIIVEIEKI